MIKQVEGQSEGGLASSGVESDPFPLPKVWNDRDQLSNLWKDSGLHWSGVLQYHKHQIWASRYGSSPAAFYFLIPCKRSHFSACHFHSPQCGVVFYWRFGGPVFVPAVEALLFWQKAPKPVTPSLALLEGPDADGRADQLAGLR